MSIASTRVLVTVASTHFLCTVRVDASSTRVLVTVAGTQVLVTVALTTFSLWKSILQLSRLVRVAACRPECL